MPKQSSVNRTRTNVYIEDDAKDLEPELAKLFDEEGYAGMYKGNGTPNRSSIVNALYYSVAGKYDKIPRK